MKTTALLRKNNCSKPEVLRAEDAWKTATDNVYCAFDLDIGLYEGALADLALIDLRRPWFSPETNMCHTSSTACPAAWRSVLLGNMRWSGK
jgi:5-methylthioadenosine/S-adenosylhomocysteine deaminase